MVTHKPEGSLTEEEKTIIKGLLQEGWRNQDIQALVNIGRQATINSARITEVKQDIDIIPAHSEQVEFFKIKKKSYDPITGLNLFDDEKLIRARESMILAVQVFNSAALRFRAEVFSVLANIAWTYLLHEYYQRELGSVMGSDGRSLLLSQMLARSDCPLSDGVKRNLRDIKEIRDTVEHLLLGAGDKLWLSRFQACCLNFDKTICSLFGERLSLQNELSFALQFARPTIDQLSLVGKYAIPPEIEALDARLQTGLTEEQLRDLEYQFRVIYTLDSSSKSRAHIEFLHPDSEHASEIRNVLLKYKCSDELYPYKPHHVVSKVKVKSEKLFSRRNHTQAWRFYQVRPKKGASQPGNTQSEYCIYHAAHNDYTYSEKWVEFLVKEIENEESYRQIISFKIK